MDYKRFLLIAVTTAITTSLQFVVILPGILPAHQVLAQTIEARKAEADRLLQKGMEQAQTSQYEAALQSWEQALKIYREIKDHQHEGWVLNNIGLTYVYLGDYSKAINYLEQSLAIARQNKKLDSEGKSILNIGLAYLQLGEYNKAINYFEQSLTIAIEIKDRKIESGTLMNIGLAYVYLGKYKKAINYSQQSLAIAKQNKYLDVKGKALMNIGIAYLQLGEYSKVSNYLEQSLAIARQNKDLNEQGKILLNIGLAYVYLDDYSKGINYLEQSLAIVRKIKDRNSEGKALGNIGIAYFYLGDYSKAISYQQQALAIARTIKDRNSEGTFLGTIGIAYFYLGDYSKAISYQQQALAILRAIKDLNGESKALSNLGVLYNSLGDYPKAIDYHQQSLAIAQKIKGRANQGAAFGNIGLAYLALGDYPKAINYLKKSLKIAREMKNRQGEGQSLVNLGITYNSLGDYPKAINYYQQSLKIAREIKERHIEGQSLNNLGFAYYKQGKLTLAETNLIKSIKVKESLRGRELKDSEKVSLFDTQTNTYRTLQKVLIAQNKPDTALEISERGRARAFVELIHSRLSPNSQESPQPPNIEQIKQIAKAQNSTLVQYSIIYDDFKITGKQQSKESEIYIWVIKPTGKVTFRKADLKPLWKKENQTLDELVSTTRKSLGIFDDQRGIFKVTPKNPVNEKIQQESLKKLHQLLVKPIADLLPTDPNQQVTFVPQGDLFLVPFPALMDEKGKYLIEKHTILTAPAIQVLELTRSQQKRIQKLPGASQQNALIVGNPTMPKFTPKYGEPGQKLSSLPGAKREAEAIAPLLNTKALTGDKATETAIKTKLPQARVIHLATHGLFDGFQGLQSSIALAPSSQDNGLLTAEEILNIKLNAELVVLSACNTGRGRITGDGVIGLSRSLFLAGTPSVIVSLWSVPDAPTAELMKDFYQNLYQKKLNKAQALRQAMLKMKEKYPKIPQKWAAFTLIGEAE